MKKVAIYVRSSKDLHDVSCKAQEEQVRKVVKANGDEVYRVFTDKALSSTQDVRPEFEEMIGLAMSKNPPFTAIYCLDTSRFGRDQHQTQTYLWTLRKKRGIEVKFINMPQTNSYLDPIFETIMSAFDELHSQQSKVKGVASMKQNVRDGYRAGGRAPFGYRLRKITTGTHRDGHKLEKSKLEPDPITAPIIVEYFERRAKCEPRKSILEDFYRRGILTPTGKRVWTMSTAFSFEKNLDVYLGHTVFYKINERIKENGRFNGYLHGVKYRPEKEWVICRDTHQPLISEETADRIRSMKKRKLRETPRRAKRVYALSGVMKCSICGANYTGDRGIYRCNSGNNPGKKCSNNDISQNTVEQAVFALLMGHVLNFRDIRQVIERVQKKLNRGNTDIVGLERRLAKIENEKRKMIRAYRRGIIDLDDFEKEMVPVKGQKAIVKTQLETARASAGAYKVDAGAVREVIENLADEVRQADPKIRKRTVQVLLDEIRISPKKGTPWERMLEIKGVHLPLTRVAVASPKILVLYPVCYIKLRSYCNHFEFYPSKRHRKPAFTLKSLTP